MDKEVRAYPTLEGAKAEAVASPRRERAIFIVIDLSTELICENFHDELMRRLW
jgi:hypothetical protein